MVEFDRIKDMVYRELDDISSHGGQMNRDCLETIGELVDILKDIGQVEMFAESSIGYDKYAGEDGYSQRGRNGNGSYGRYYFDDGMNYGNSYRGGRYMNRGRGYSRDDGRQYMIQELENLMNEAQNEHDRQEIKKLVDKMKNS